jgi:hypothetical protein
LLEEENEGNVSGLLNFRKENKVRRSHLLRGKKMERAIIRN